MVVQLVADVEVKDVLGLLVAPFDYEIYLRTVPDRKVWRRVELYILDVNHCEVQGQEQGLAAVCLNRDEQAQ